MFKKSWLLAAVLGVSCVSCAWGAINEQFNGGAGTVPDGNVWDVTLNPYGGTNILAEDDGAGSLIFGATGMASGTYSKSLMITDVPLTRIGADSHLEVIMKYKYAANNGRDYFDLWLTTAADGPDTLNGISYGISGFGGTPGANYCRQWENATIPWEHPGHQRTQGYIPPDTWHWIKLYLYYDSALGYDRIGFYYSYDGVSWDLATRPGVRAALQGSSYYLSLKWSGREWNGLTNSLNYVDFLTATPEPGTMLLLGLGGLLISRRRK